MPIDHLLIFIFKVILSILLIVISGNLYLKLFNPEYKDKILRFSIYGLRGLFLVLFFLSALFLYIQYRFYIGGYNNVISNYDIYLWDTLEIYWAVVLLYLSISISRSL